MKSDMKRGTLALFIVVFSLSGTSGEHPFTAQKTDKVIVYGERGIEMQGNEMTPEFLKEFVQKSQQWPYIQRLYKENYFDSVITNDDQVILLFKDPQGVGDMYFVWGRSSTPHSIQGVTGLFWVSYSGDRLYTDIKDARDIYVSEKALVMVPLPESPVISSVYVEGSPVQSMRTQGDLWFTTWADDDNLYCSWGDGTGIGKGPFTDMGIGCLTGTLPDITGVTRYRDPCTEKDDLSQNNKPSSLLFFDGRLYAHVHSPLGDPALGYLAYSDDYGATWKKAPGDSPWTREVDSNFRCLFFINMGKNYELNTDSYVYALGMGKEWGWEKGMHMARVSRKEILDYTAYEYLITVEDGIPCWSSSQFDARPIPGIFTRDQASAMYHPGIERFLLLTAQDVFDAPNPWGPWTYAGSWARPPPQGWVGGYQPGIISKDTGKDYFWFTIAGQPQNPWSRTEVKYCLNVGKIVLQFEGESDITDFRADTHRKSMGLILIVALITGVILIYALTRRGKAQSGGV